MDDAVPPDSRPLRRRRWRRWLLASTGLVITLGLVVWFVVIPYPWTLRNDDPARSALMQQRVSEARDQGVPFEIRQDWVPLDEISPELVRAVIVAEDYRFRQHEGVDWVSLAEEVAWTGDDDFSWLSASDLGALVDAVRYASAHKDELRGRSTITQQLAKNLYFGTERTFARKGLELVVARRLERRLGKDRILELYLNTAEWGPGIFGAEAAAREYFGRPASALTLEQGATLAATLPHPLTSNAKLKPSRMLWRRDLLLSRLDPGRNSVPVAVPARELTIPAARDMALPVFHRLGELEPMVGSVRSATPISAVSPVPGEDGVQSADSTAQPLPVDAERN